MAEVVFWCQDHGVRDQDGTFIHRGERCCNETVRKEGGVPILCSHALVMIPVQEERFVDGDGEVFIRYCVLPNDRWWGRWEGNRHPANLDPARTHLTPEPPDYEEVLAGIRAELREASDENLSAAVASVVRQIDALLPPVRERTVPEKLHYIADKLREEAAGDSVGEPPHAALLAYSSVLDQIAEDVDA